MPIFPISRTSTARYTREGGGGGKRQDADSVPLVVRSGECAYGNLKYDIRLRTHGRSLGRRSQDGAENCYGLIVWYTIAKFNPKSWPNQRNCVKLDYVLNLTTIKTLLILCPLFAHDQPQQVK